MASIVYKSLSALTPIELKYEYYKNEDLRAATTTYKSGLSLYRAHGLDNFRDLSINRESCLMLSPALELSAVFTSTKEEVLGKQPGSVQLQARNSLIYYVKYDEENNRFAQKLQEASTFFIQPLAGSNEAEIFVNNKYLQIDEEYPYVARLGNRSLDPESIHRQRFEVTYQDGYIMFSTRTNAGYRYLALNNDNILRAVGLVLNESVINDYVFKSVEVTKPTLNQGFAPTNNWVTYYYDIEQEKNNKTVVINKDIKPTKTNLLFDFSLEKAAEQGKININIANLKTGVTPAGGPAPVSNAYTKYPITTN